MSARAIYTLIRVLGLCLAVTLVQPIAVAATYSSFQDLITNESLIAGYGTEAIDGYTARPNFILEKTQMAIGLLTPVSNTPYQQRPRLIFRSIVRV